MYQVSIKSVSQTLNAMQMGGDGFFHGVFPCGRFLMHWSMEKLVLWNQVHCICKSENDTFFVTCK